MNTSMDSTPIVIPPALTPATRNLVNYHNNTLPGAVNAAVAADSVLSFSDRLTDTQRKSVLNSTLFAQLLAQQQTPPGQDWFASYCTILATLGWRFTGVWKKQVELHHLYWTLLELAFSIVAENSPVLDLTQVQQVDRTFRALLQSTAAREVFRIGNDHHAFNSFQFIPVNERANGLLDVQLHRLELSSAVPVTSLLDRQRLESRAMVKLEIHQVQFHPPGNYAIQQMIQERLGQMAETFIVGLMI
ncbi:hypothetical protein LOY54_25490 [Pseudomonas sp. B21-032]|uniref:hypothetical protein n=1 Tax=Pseudomonas sp. B21-032 TaxID=2895483 RepID=UPI00215FB4BE|nr:hypothetical protein [Pseudomonas sp. B21-032]UVL61315.1 hypothetical protein LOY54_25490 [Pseudomonas sp. B21-032]